MTEIWSDNTLGLDGTRVIDRRIYVDRQIFEAEREALFARTWQWVAHESELPAAGDYVTAVIAGRHVVVARDRELQLHAFFNTCTHRGAQVAVGAKGNCGGKFVCMYHGWSFDASGRLMGVAWADGYGPDFERRRYDIPRIRVETFAGHVFVALDANVPPLAEFLGEAGPYIERFTGRHEALGRVRWSIEGNWKLWHENFRDNYHPQFTHRQVSAQYRGIDVKGTNLALEPAHSLLKFPRQGDRKQVGVMLNEIGGYDIDITRSPAGRAPPVPVDPENKFMEILAVFPNLDLQCFMNGVAGILLQVLRPIDVDQTVVEGVVFGARGESAEMRAWRLRRDLDTQSGAGKISGDDVEAVKRCQAGYSALREVRWSNIDRGHAPGKTGGKHDEYSQRIFYSNYKRYMGEALESESRRGRGERATAVRQ
jgi:benzoate/toluate 1,2-dioxygenase alpha subunit